MLLKHVNDHPVHWLQSVPVVRQQYWARLHSALGMSPFEMVYGRQPVPVLPMGKVLLSAVRAGVSLVSDLSLEDAECPAPFEHVRQLRERMLAVDKAVFDQIREQFRQNAAAWPLRGAGLRKLPELKVGEWFWRCYQALWLPWTRLCWVLSEWLSFGTVVWLC
jgi:hypothetical protein